MAGIGVSFLVFTVQVASLVGYQYEENYFTQKLDHFSFAIDRSYQQRYLVNSSYWSTGGPIFFYAGNEGDIELFAENTGFMWDIAPEFKALLLFAEHRYYGKSLPFGKDSYKNASMLGYLTTEQAMADFATLLTHFKKTVDGAKNSPVIAFGGSYGGMLAAWMRVKYPHVIQGAIASSAPVLQFQGVTPCGAFGRIVTQDFAKESDTCAEIIRKSWKAINDVTSTGSMQKLTDSKLEGKALLEHLNGGLSVYTNYTGNTKCVDISQAAEDTLGEAGWDFQACTEMVMPMCYDGKRDFFEPTTWNFTSFSEECHKKFGVRPRLHWAEIEFGGKKLEAASNIVFSNGLLDPWSSGGVMTSLSDSLPAVIIPEGAHHLDLRSSDPADPPSVVKARKLEKYYIRTWIKMGKSF